MRKDRRKAALLLAAAMLPVMMPMQAAADNPIVQDIYTSDPAPMVYGDTLYVYTGHDADGADNFVMPDWQCRSTTDMQNWTDHGTILSYKDFSWAQEDTAWAAQCIERNGKFYLYVTLVPAATGGRAIGVAVADSPTGPFKDAIGKPLCGPNWDFIDPTVFIDDDGQAWLYFGNPRLYYVKLNEDMISIDGEIRQFEMTTQAFGVKDDHTTYTEGPWIHKRGQTYYMLYAANGVPEDIRYSTAPSPTGPWTYQGVIMPRQGGSFTNHCGIVDYKGHSYFAYHNGALPGGHGFQRSVCMEEFTWTEDGKIPQFDMTKEGPRQIEDVDPFVRNEAEKMSWSEGIEIEACSAGGRDVGFIENKDYVKVSGVGFGDGAAKFKASIASAGSGGKIELHLDAASGPVIGVCDVPVTGGWQDWEEVTCDVVGAEGTHDLYLVFSGGESYLFNVDWWQFLGDEPEAPVLLGDIDDNGVVDVFDLAMAKRGLLGSFKDERAARAADVDCNTTNDILDFMLLWKYIHALIPGFDQNTVG
ncbi:MAG: family 43 glycosylhydrolase [Oscillospiraceae bacterium]|nr:family 43 glycosylhydrolase [Oscillospiraceae bacterium]